MKHFNSILVAALIILSVGVVNAQDADNPWAIEVGVNAVDVFPVGLKTDKQLNHLQEVVILMSILIYRITGIFYHQFLKYQLVIT